jgi:hypothetical protein
MSTSPLVNQYVSIPTLQLGGLVLEPSLQNRGTILERDDSAHIGGKADEMILSLVRRVSYFESSSRISLVGTYNYNCVLLISERPLCVRLG